ncbi:unnamed protein product [Symbiodinium microadriaticum]|nr:unnamed protein product [Symbiodinium microadriaticum]
MVDVAVPPEIPLKILNVFTDQDGDIRVKEDNLREVLSRFRNYSRDITVQVLSTLRNELADQVGAVRDSAELARAQLAEDLHNDLATKKVLAEVEELAQGAHAKADVLGVQLKSMDGRLRQIAATVASQAQTYSGSDDLAMTAPAVMSSSTLNVEREPSETFAGISAPARGATFSPKSEAGAVNRTFSARSAAGTQAPEPARNAASKADVEALLSSQEALWKEAVAAVQEEVADLSAKQKDLEKSLQTSATSSDLEALRDLQKAADEQLSQVRLEISEELAEIQRFALQTYEDGASSMTSRLDSDKHEIEGSLEALRERTGALEALSSNEDQRLESALRATDDRLSSVEEGLRLANVQQMQEYLAQLAADIAALAQTTCQKAEGSEVARAAAQLEETSAKVAEMGLRLSSALQRVWPHLERLDDRALKLEGWSREAVKELKALRSVDSELALRLDRLADEVQEVVGSSEEKCQALERCLQAQATSAEQKDVATTELITTLEERLETLEMDLETETRRAKEKVEESIHDFSDKICAFEEAIKDKEQAVHFGARCLSCNRTFDDVVKTPGSVNLPAEKRRAQVFAEIQRALHTPRTDPETIKLLAVKVGRPTAVTAKQGSYASRNGDCLANGLEDVQLLPVRTTSLSRSVPPSRSQCSPRPPSKTSTSNVRPQSETSSCWTHRRGEAPAAWTGRRHRAHSKVNEDIKSAVS